MKTKIENEDELDKKAREFGHLVLAEVVKGQTVRCWFSFGLEPQKDYNAPIPNVTEIQASILGSKCSKVASDLSANGRADLHTDGLLPDSIEWILRDCVAKGYQTWKRNPPDNGISGQYYIVVTATDYCEKYYENVTENYRNER
jgi:hypothetical protein